MEKFLESDYYRVGVTWCHSQSTFILLELDLIVRPFRKEEGIDTQSNASVFVNCPG